MKRTFRYKIFGEKIYILKRDIGLFGPQLETVAFFDTKNGNVEKAKQIVKQLNGRDGHKEHPNQND